MSCNVGEATESLKNEQSSFSKPTITSSTSQLILQTFRRFTYAAAHSPTLPLLHLRHISFPNPSVIDLRHSSFSNPSVVLPTLQFILQPFRCFTYVTVHSPTFPLLYLRHSSFSNPSVALPTSQFILQPFFRFSYVTSSSLNSWFLSKRAHYSNIGEIGLCESTENIGNLLRTYKIPS